MSYCVNCGVELGQSAEKCPLCGTQAWHPEHWTPDAPYFPTKPAVVEPVSKRALALVLTSMLVSVSLCCGMLNLILTADNPAYADRPMDGGGVPCGRALPLSKHGFTGDIFII